METALNQYDTNGVTAAKGNVTGWCRIEFVVWKPACGAACAVVLKEPVLRITNADTEDPHELDLCGASLRASGLSCLLQAMASTEDMTPAVLRPGDSLDVPLDCSALMGALDGALFAGHVDCVDVRLVVQKESVMSFFDMTLLFRRLDIVTALPPPGMPFVIGTTLEETTGVYFVDTSIVVSYSTMCQDPRMHSLHILARTKDDGAEEYFVPEAVTQCTSDGEPLFAYTAVPSWSSGPVVQYVEDGSLMASEALPPLVYRSPAGIFETWSTPYVHHIQLHGIPVGKDYIVSLFVTTRRALCM